MDKVTLERSISEGYASGEHQIWLIQQFCDYAAAKDVRQTNWQATLRNFLSSTYTRDKFKSKFGFFPGHQSREVVLLDGVVVKTSKMTAAERLRATSDRSTSFGGIQAQTFAQRAATRNSDLMAGALERRFERANEDQHEQFGMSP